MKKMQLDIPRYRPQEWICIIIIGIILSITLLTGVLSPPNNWDSMTYHMSRVATWIQHQNVNFYPTSIDRQNYLSPLAEYAILHLQILKGSDVYANLVQWYSFFNAILLASLIGKEFQLSRSMQIFAGLFVATLPMAILQGSSTQNDLVSGALCAGFAYFLLRFVKTSSFHDALFCAISLGLSLLAKGTSYIYCLAIGLTISAMPLLSSLKLKSKYCFIKCFILIALTCMLINAGHFSRNFNLYGHPLSTAAAGCRNDRLSVSNLFSNVIRNAALHLATPSNRLNSFLMQTIESVIDKRHLNNPETTYLNNKFSIHFSLHEDTAGNPLHFGLILTALIILLFRPSVRKPAALVYTGAVIFSVFLFCLLLKWQPWASRLHTPVFILSAPLVALVVGACLNHNKKLSFCLAVILFFYCVPFLFINLSRPLLSPAYALSLILPPENETLKLFKSRYDYSIINTERKKLYFTNRPEIYSDYRTATQVALNERTGVIGLYLGGDDWEYPFWIFAGNNAGKRPPEFRHVGVNDISNTIKKHESMPSIVIATKKPDGNIISGTEYFVIFESKHVCVLKMKNQA